MSQNPFSSHNITPLQNSLQNTLNNNQIKSPYQSNIFNQYNPLSNTYNPINNIMISESPASIELEPKKKEIDLIIK